jgi:putative nucleotidyltransferase with HDIG domain
MIYGFARAIELKDSYTGRHVEDTAFIAEEIAKELKLPPSEIENIKRAAILHDLGKVGIDERILSKKGPLNENEKEIIKSHPWIAAEILREIHALRGSIPAILYHHERYDGKGYPLGLKGEDIPLGARIVAIADVYQALISDRPYRKAYSKREAIEIIKKDAGKKFDPKIVKIFLKIIKKRNKII